MHLVYINKKLVLHNPFHAPVKEIYTKCAKYMSKHVRLQTAMEGKHRLFIMPGSNVSGYRLGILICNKICADPFKAKFKIDNVNVRFTTVHEVKCFLAD